MGIAVWARVISIFATCTGVWRAAVADRKLETQWTAHIVWRLLAGQAVHRKFDILIYNEGRSQIRLAESHVYALKSTEKVQTYALSSSAGLP